MTSDDLDRMEAEYRRAEGNGHVISPVGALKLCAALREARAERDMAQDRADRIEAERDEARAALAEAMPAVTKALAEVQMARASLANADAVRRDMFGDAAKALARVEELCDEADKREAYAHGAARST